VPAADVTTPAVILADPQTLRRLDSTILDG
jgi:hypothetical protein